MNRRAVGASARARATFAGLIFAGGLAVLAGCATGGSEMSAASEVQALREARERLLTSLKTCTAQFDYDPDQPGLPQSGLAPHELDWRQCAYAAGRRYVESNAALAPDYAALIDEDQRLTDALAAGELTRSERRARLQPLIDAIHAKEEAQIESLETEQAKEMELVRQVTNGLRGLN